MTEEDDAEEVDPKNGFTRGGSERSNPPPVTRQAGVKMA